MASAQAPLQDPRVVQPAAPGGPIRVLLVDDHPMVRRVLVSLLEAEPGLAVVGQAGNGLAALALALELRPEVVVTDVTMPVMDGIQLTRRLGQERPEIKVVGLSMHREDSVGAAMLQAGAAAYLTKETAFADLVAAIRRAAARVD